MEGLSVLAWAGGMVVLAAGVALPLVYVAYRHRGTLGSGNASWKR